MSGYYWSGVKTVGFYVLFSFRIYRGSMLISPRYRGRTLYRASRCRMTLHIISYLDPRIPVLRLCVSFFIFCLGLLFFLLSRSVISFLSLCCSSRLFCVSQFWWFISGNRFFCSRYFFYSQFVFCLAYLAIWLFIVSPSYRVGHVGRSIVWSRRPIDHALIRVSLCHFFCYFVSLTRVYS